MKRILYPILAICLNLTATGSEYSAIMTAKGILAVHDTPDLRFTMEIPGNKIELRTDPKHFSVVADGTQIQMQALFVTDIFGKSVEISPKGLLLAHRDWEERHQEKKCKVAMTSDTGLVMLSDNTEALLWLCRMADGVDSDITPSLYLTRVSGERLIVLNAVMGNGGDEQASRKALLAAANSFCKHEGPIDMEKLKETAKNPPAAAAAVTKDTGGNYEFPLNKRGGGIRILSGAKPPRIEFYDDYGSGVEVTWDSGLTLVKDGAWQTERGLFVSVENLAKPVANNGKLCDWKLKFSGKNPGFREHQKVLPQVDFGDPENGYFGNLIAGGGKPSKQGKDTAHTPTADSPERMAIMGVLRFDFYKDKKKARENPDKIFFVVHHLKVKDGWACVNVTPTKNGKEMGEPRWAVLRYQGESWEDVDYFDKLRPLSSEAESLDVLDMKAEIVRRLLSKLPGCPREIFP